MVEEEKVAEDKPGVPNTENQRPFNRVLWSVFAGLAFGLSGLLAVLFTFKRVPSAFSGMIMLQYITPLAPFLTGTFFWWLLVSRTKRITIARGVWVGMLIGMLSHFFAWYAALLVSPVPAVQNVPGAQMPSLTQYLLIGLGNSVMSIIGIGWITVPGGGLLGGILVYLQSRKLTTKESKGRNKARKSALIIIITVAIVLLLKTCIVSDGPYSGKVVELDTGKPIEGAVVAGRWYVGLFINTVTFCDARETVTDNNGEFELPKGWCIGPPVAKMSPADVVVFKPGYLGYPPIGNTDEAHLFTGHEFGDKNQYNFIRLGKPKTRNERELTLDEAEFILDVYKPQQLPKLYELTDEESVQLGFGKRPRPDKYGGNR